MTPTGLTKDAGWELGVRRTVPLPSQDVWDYLIGPGRRRWLGHAELGTNTGDRYTTADGVEGEIRGFTEGQKLRITWRPTDWRHDSTLQISVRPAASGTTIGIHQERLADAAERERMLTHWTQVMDKIMEDLAAPGE
ncbi:SRPBCC domain-containing protein [Lysobacter korlensis]|uniref:SRPBCC domain-containing protein n=1 Tax=Lysobacter korlensis TaxID=553636 RepID=A0ABV6RWZ5_9GAMM